MKPGDKNASDDNCTNALNLNMNQEKLYRSWGYMIFLEKSHGCRIKCSSLQQPPSWSLSPTSPLLSFLKTFIYLFQFFAALGLRHCIHAFFSCRQWELLFIVMCGLLTAVVSLVAEHGLRCSVACGIFPDQGSNLSPLHWQADY